MNPRSQISVEPDLRVLHVLGELRPSGAESMLRIAAPYFASEGIAGEILSTGERGVGSYAEELSAAGYKIHHVPFAKRLGFFLSLRALVREGAFDVVHFHVERASGWMSLSVSPHPAIFRTIHSQFPFTGWLGTRRRATRLLARLVGVRHIAIAPGVAEAERIFLGNPTVVYPNWIDTKHFRPPSAEERSVARQSFGLRADQIAIASIGNCRDIKNHAAIIDAMGQLLACQELIYLHVGNEVGGRDERDQAARLGLGDRARFLGSLTDVRPVLFAADLLVMPSLYEGFSIAALEAIACEVPVLLADSPGLRDFRTEFPGARFCPPTGAGVAAGINAFLNDDPRPIRLHSRDDALLVRNKFDVAEGVDRYAKAYRYVLGTRKNRTIPETDKGY